jgi:aminoglycoside phosphotransferase (APT) family kinase protein
MAPRRRTTLDLTPETVQRILRSLDPSLNAGPFGRLEGGSTEVYKIEAVGADAKPLVLKIYPNEPVWAPAKEASVASRLTALTPPVPRWLRVDESRTILPLRFAISTLLPGRPLRHWFGDPDIASAYRQMGEFLRRVHAIPMAAYGYIQAEGIVNAQVTNAEHMAGAFEEVFRRFRDIGGDAGLGRRLEQLAKESFSLLSERSIPVLCHDDFHQGNVLAIRGADGGLHLSGLVDFGNARAADPLFDLAKALFCSAHEDARSFQPLLQGYGPIDHPEPEKALRLYTLFHRVTMWCWLTTLGPTGSADAGPAGLLRDLREMVH